MTFIKDVDPCTLTLPIEGEDRGLLMFDRTGALLGGGTLDDSRKTITDRWRIVLVDDWADKADPIQSEIGTLTYRIDPKPVTPELCTLVKKTLDQLGAFVAANEERWKGKLEGVLSVFERFGLTDEFISGHIENEKTDGEPDAHDQQ